MGMSIFDKLTERVGDFFDEVMLPEPVRRAHDAAGRDMSAERYDKALQALRPSLIEHPNVARTHHLIGMCHFHRQEWGAAIAAFERALSIKEVAASHFYAGLAAEQVTRWNDVQRHFSRALSLAEELPFAFDLHIDSRRGTMRVRNHTAARGKHRLNDILFRHCPFASSKQRLDVLQSSFILH